MRIRSIQDSLVMAFALIVAMTIVLIGAASLSFFRRNLVDSAQASTMQFAAQLSRIVDNYIAYMDDIALVVMEDSDVRAYMEAPGRGDSRRRIERFLGSIRNVRRDIDGIFLIPCRDRTPLPSKPIKAGEVIASAPGPGINPYFDFAAYPRPSGGFAVSSARVENLIDGRYPWVISLVRELPDGRGGVLGYIQVDLNYAIIDSLCRDAQPGASGYVFILGATGELVYHPRQQLIYSSLKSEKIRELLALRSGFLSTKVDGRDILYTAKPSEKTGWIIVVVSYMSELLAGARRAILAFIVIAALCFVVAALASSIVSARISRPIESLRRSMQEVEKGNFDIDITVASSDEIYQLARDCDIAVKKVRDLIEQNRKEGEQKRLLELRALQAQINPHFLYNTLDSIIWMIELEDNEEAIDVTSSLARFFRLGVNRGAEYITIRTEIEYLETYLSIQKARYKKKLDYEISFGPRIYDCRLLKLLVQPIVENAIYHGIKNKESPGVVRILGDREDDALLIRVIDDGVGMDPERIEVLRRRLAAPSDRFEDEGGEDGIRSSGGVGVRNVQERIQLCCGSGYGLSYESKRGEGTVATIRLPIMEGAETEGGAP